MISSAPAVKAALVARLAADPAIGPAHHVSHGHPYPAAPPSAADRALIEVRRVRPGDPVGDRGAGHSQAAHGSRGQREERYTIDVIVTVAGAAAERYPEMEALAYAVAGLVDQNVRDWAHTQPSPYDGLARWVLVANVEDDEALSNDGREASVTISLAVAARV